MTPTQRKALEIIRDCPGITANEFFKRMWPNSTVSKRGTGRQKAGGSYVGKLRKLGWVTDDAFVTGSAYLITAEGLKALNEEI